MSNLIEVLEGLGRSPCISVARSENYIASVTALALDVPQRRALLDRDAKALGDLAGARGTLRCLIATPD